MMACDTVTRTHGGPDGIGVPAHDFSTNGNACGPCPEALLAVAAADPTRYPDPAYTALRARLADFHEVSASRVVIAGSGSEFIWRLSAWARAKGGQRVWAPRHAYGEYLLAARACGLSVAHEPALADLAWACDPSSPLGEADSDVERLEAPIIALDLAYAPLRLSGPAGRLPQPTRVWQLWSPNKALGLTGIRAAYAIAPEGREQAVQEVEALAASWPVGAHGVALLQAWCEPATQAWLAQSLHVLQRWKQRQLALCADMGWAVRPGTANFHTAVPCPGNDNGATAMRLRDLRARGVKLRDCTSFGLPGQARLAVLPPGSQDALKHAWESLA